MLAVAPYLNFDGNAEEVFNFYQSVFGGELVTVMRFKDAPREFQFQESEDNKIMHISLATDQKPWLMGSDVPEAFGKPVTGTNFYISISTASEEESNTLFNRLTTEGQVIMPLAKSFWGSYFGMCKDKFGVQWMFSYEYPQQ